MKALYAALLKAQPLIDAALKDKKNPHFKSTYADINSVIDACKKQLNDVGIIVLQPVVILDQGPAVKTILIHAESGEWVESVVPLIGASDMQKLGSAITYARRYGLQALVLLGAEDDDGHRASAKAPELYTGSEEQKKNLKIQFTAAKVPEALWQKISDALLGRPAADWRIAWREVK